MPNCLSLTVLLRFRKRVLPSPARTTRATRQTEANFGRNKLGQHCGDLYHKRTRMSNPTRARLIKTQCTVLQTLCFVRSARNHFTFTATFGTVPLPVTLRAALAVAKDARARTVTQCTRGSMRKPTTQETMRQPFLDAEHSPI